MAVELNLSVPSIAKLERVSASRAFDLVSCQLRGAWVRFGRTVPASSAAALGNACHEFVASVYEGVFDQTPEVDLGQELLRSLDKSIAKEYARQRTLTGTFFSIPPPRRWRNLQRARHQLTAAMHREVLRRKSSDADSVQLVERTLLSSDGRIEGQPDRVDRTSSGDRIIDFKTGWDGEGDIPLRFRHQLLIYAYLWQQSQGNLPSEAALQALDGQIRTIRVDPAEVMSVVDEVLAAMDAVNSAIDNKTDPESLASPSDAHCSFCPWRPQCAPFFLSAGSSDGLERAALLGDVRDREVSYSRVALTIGLVASRPSIGSAEARVLDVPSAFDVAVGDRVSVVDVRSTGHGAQFRWQGWSACWNFGTARQR